MKHIPLECLEENELTNALYSEDEAFESLVKSILIHGVLEPLKVQPSQKESSYLVISGNRRLRAAREIGLYEVPCIVDVATQVDKAIIMAHQSQRIKKLSEILMESVALHELYGHHFKQGKSSKDQSARDAREHRSALEKKAGGKHVVKSLLVIHDLIEKLSGNDEKKKRQYLKKLDVGKSIRGTTRSLQRELDDKRNAEAVPVNYEVRIGDVAIYPRSSEEVEGIELESIQLIVTSPPYFAIRDYGLGDDELGHESKIAEFIDRLCRHMNRYKSLLRPDGTMWVNLGDYVLGYGYEMIAERFALVMMDSYGWILHDKIIWVKNNPVFTNSNRTVLANEFIFVFKKKDFVYFDLSWVQEHGIQDSRLTIGKLGGKIKLRSVFDFRDNVVQTNSVNNHELSMACEKHGVALTHNATFPLSIPTIAILTSTKMGDLVMDPFSGTATTARAAQLFGRRFIGFELNPAYMRQGEIRLNMPFDLDIESIAA